MTSILAGLVTVVLAWTVISMLAAASRRLAASESPILRAASLVTCGCGIWLTYDLVKFILVG